MSPASRCDEILRLCDEVLDQVDAVLPPPPKPADAAVPVSLDSRQPMS
jgi:hypothetical protein